MKSLLLSMTQPETVAAATAVALLFLAIGVVIVLAVRSVPAKLILIGMLLMAAAVLTGGFVPQTAGISTTMAILAVLVILAGVLCIMIAFIAQTLRKPDTDKVQST